MSKPRSKLDEQISSLLSQMVIPTGSFTLDATYFLTQVELKETEAAGTNITIPAGLSQADYRIGGYTYFTSTSGLEHKFIPASGTFLNGGTNTITLPPSAAGGVVRLARTGVNQYTLQVGVSDGGGGGGSSFSGARLFQSSFVVSIPNNTNTNLSFDTIQFEDTDTWVDLATDDQIFTIPSGVTRVITEFAIFWDPGLSNTGYRKIVLIHNGNDITADMRNGVDSGSSRGQYISSGPLEVAEGDTIGVRVIQTSGASMNIVYLEGAFFSIYKLA